MKGTYHYHHIIALQPRLVLQKCKMPVEIVQEKGKRYLVRYLFNHKNGIDKRGSEHWVMKRKVIIEPSEQREISLPYKD